MVFLSYFLPSMFGEGGADYFDDVASEEGTEAGGGTKTATFGEGVEETC